MSILNFFKKRKVRPRAAFKRTLKPYDVQKIKEEWGEITKLSDLGGPSNLKEAVIRADKLIDYALQQLVRGETLGERLKSAKEYFDKTTYNNLWKAHKMRNALVHETDFEPPYYVSQETIGNFRQALEVLCNTHL